MDSLRTVVGARIKALRKAQNLSQAQLADLLLCDAPLVSRYERGATLPNIEQLIKISMVFNVSPGELLPNGQDSITAKLISLRQTLTEKILHVDKPESLEKLIDLADQLIASARHD